MLPPPYRVRGNRGKGEEGEILSGAYHVLTRVRFSVLSGTHRNAGYSHNALYLIIFIESGRSRTRTCDPLIKSQLLYRLSYAPRPGIRGRAGLSKGRGTSPPDGRAGPRKESSNSPHRHAPGGWPGRSPAMDEDGQIMPEEERGTTMLRWTCTLISKPNPNITVIIALPP